MNARAAEGERVAFTGGAGKLVGDKWYNLSSGSRKGAVLLLHGGGQTRHSWFRTAADLAEHGWDAVAVDARGHGDSEWSADGDYSIDALVGDLACMVNELGERPILVGASMGGMTSMVGQGERGDLARALVLVDIVPKIEPAGAQRIMDFMRGNPDGFGSLDEAAEAVRRYNPTRSRPSNPEGLRKNLRLRDNARWYWHWDPAFLRLGDEPRRAISEARAQAAASKIRVPTLLVRGERSDIVSVEGAKQLLALIPGSEQVDVSATGHMVAGDDNEVFTNRVVEFLNRLSQ